MPRLTRAERQAATRTELLTAACRRFLEYGYAATSLEQIADDAGYSKGAIYSNFRDKPTLCREVLSAVHHEKVAEIEAIVRGEGDLRTQIEMMERWLGATVGDIGWTMLEMEVAVMSRTDPGMRQMVSDLRDGMHMSIRAAMRAVGERIDPDIDPTHLDLLADQIVSSAFGLGVQRSVDPEISIEPLLRFIRDAVAGLSGNSPHSRAS